MKDDLKDIELIEAYLESQLVDSDKEAFEQRLQTDVEFKRLFDQTTKLIEGIRLHGRDNLLSQLKQEEESLSNSNDNIRHLEPRKSGNRNIAVMSIAAIGLLLIGSLIVFRMINQNSSTQLAAYKEPLPQQMLYNNVRGETIEGQEVKKQAAELYGSQKYVEAADQLESLFFDLNDTSLIVQKFYTNSLLQHSSAYCGKLESRFIKLENTTASNHRKNLVLLDLAIWQIQCDDKIEAQKNLNYIIDASNDEELAIKAKELLQLTR